RSSRHEAQYSAEKLEPPDVGCYENEIGKFADMAVRPPCYTTSLSLHYSTLILVFSRSSVDDPPTLISMRSGSTTNARRPVSQYASDSAFNGSSTVLLSPARSGTRWNARSSLIGRATFDWRCFTYNCTTSSPPRLPEFFTSTLTVNAPSRASVVE